jgi:hypothetical protein
MAAPVHSSGVNHNFSHVDPQAAWFPLPLSTPLFSEGSYLLLPEALLAVFVSLLAYLCVCFCLLLETVCNLVYNLVL